MDAANPTIVASGKLVFPLRHTAEGFCLLPYGKAVADYLKARGDWFDFHGGPQGQLRLIKGDGHNG